jgi:two-component system, NtrC family, response regulator AtoC
MRVPAAILRFSACFGWNAALHICGGMPPLLHDRYLMIDARHARDLATGDAVRIDELGERRTGRAPSSPELLELLDHGRDGDPRAVRIDLRSPGGWKGAVDRVATEAVDRGYVPIGVDIYARLFPVMPDEISLRSLVLIASDHTSCARAVFLDAASRSARPHVLLTIRSSRTSASQVREARAAYGVAPRPRVVSGVPTDVLQQLQRARRASEFVAAGRHAAAERLLRDVAAALGRRSAWAQAVRVLLSLGRLLLERGRPLNATDVFCEAIAAAGSAGDEWLAAEARIWLATARTDAGQLTAAESICRSLLLVAGMSEPLTAWTYSVLARVLLWQERIDEALAIPATSMEGALDDDTEAYVRSIRVRALLRGDHIFEAGVKAGELLAVSGGAAPIVRVIALTCYLRVLAAAGDLIGAQRCLRDIAEAARRARAPLRLARARLVWADALRAAGRDAEAERQFRALSRIARAAPTLFRHAIERRVAAPRGKPRGVRLQADGFDTAAALVRLSQDEEDDGRAIARLLEIAAQRLQATRVDLWSCDAGPATIVRSVGTGLASTIGGRVLEAGIVIGPEGSDVPAQVGVPIRLGSRLVGAIVARWPVDRVPPAGAPGALELLAAVAATRADALLHRTRLEAEASTLIPELVGISRVMTDVRQAVARAALSPFSILIEGESGVGKELIARAVHYLSPRRERRFCDVNCAALPDELIESELFGHAKGAFTGAVSDRAGLFEEAHGGTLFLDEIADLSLRAQAKLLRVLQQQEIRRVGETFARPVDVRLVAAANRDMRAEAAAARFRQDLLYRVDVIRINVPALRERPQDIPALVQHFWRTAADRVGSSASLTPVVLSSLTAYHWPGNVRELQNVVAALAVAAPRRGRVGADLLPAAISGAMPLRTSNLAEARDQFERRFVEAALARAGGNRAKTARALGLSRQGLLKLMERLKVGSGAT